MPSIGISIIGVQCQTSTISVATLYPFGGGIGAPQSLPRRLPLLCQHRFRSLGLTAGLTESQDHGSWRGLLALVVWGLLWSHGCAFGQS